MDVVLNKSVNKILPYIKAIKYKALPAPISLHILITDHCANRCNMCGHWKTKIKHELKFDIIKQIWDDANKYGVESICLTGGDPVLHTNFEDILKLERKFKLGIITSGNFKKNFDFSLLKNLDFIRFSLDSLDKEIYYKIRGRNNLHEIIENILTAKKYNNNIGINFTIQKLNVHEVIDIAKFVVKNGIKRLIIYPVHHAGDLELDKHDKERLIITLYHIITTLHYDKIIDENNLGFMFDWLAGEIQFKKPHVEVPCIINKIHLAIDAQGNIYPCETQVDDTDVQYRNDDTSVLGNVYKEKFIDVWRKFYDKEFVSHKCNLCFSRYMPINETYHKYKDCQIFI